jgi:hypothetical protein
MHKPALAIAVAALVLGGLGFAAAAQQKPIATKANANTVIVYKSPT